MEVRQRSLGVEPTLNVALGPTFRRTLAAGAFVVLTTLGAYAAIPLPWTPIPMTLQPLFVLLAGLVLGPTLGATSMVSYVVLGAVGLPVFAGGQAGIAWLMGPTGGFILAFPAAAFVTGWLAESKDSGTVRLLAALVGGLAVIYLGGTAQLALLMGRTVADALALAVVPFLVGDVIESLVALAIATRVRPKSVGRL